MQGIHAKHSNKCRMNYNLCNFFESLNYMISKTQNGTHISCSIFTAYFQHDCWSSVQTTTDSVVDQHKIGLNNTANHFISYRNCHTTQYTFS